MKKTALKVISVALVVMTVFLTCTCAFAGGTDETVKEEPTRYTYINSATLTFTINGITAVGSASLTAKKSTNLQIVMTLQKQNSNGTWSNVQTWSKTGSGNTLSMEKSKLINVLNTYRLKGTFSAGGETTTIYRYH